MYVTREETAEDALRYSLNNRGCVDLDYMKTLYPKDEEEIIAKGHEIAKKLI